MLSYVTKFFVKIPSPMSFIELLSFYMNLLPTRIDYSFDTADHKLCSALSSFRMYATTSNFTRVVTKSVYIFSYT